MWEPKRSGRPSALPEGFCQADEVPAEVPLLPNSGLFRQAIPEALCSSEAKNMDREARRCSPESGYAAECVWRWAD